ncbi:DNA invertase [Agrobacterium tumefaciens]|uniref:recombinase family protein n=1 Tax=Agrobacterium tumefaciens TaxID=358 RepID=UPI0012B7A422|nr:recombinase family protein [Agrobacterium tumefaciens]MQB04040.1 DNA invertase [Agrobacterium tumefaciens]
MKRYVVYTRVSTADQGKSGLGLEAQERDIELFLSTYHSDETPYELLAEFRDVQSGKDDDRPELAKALTLARKEKAELLVAKLDRLSRDVAFIAQTMKQATIRVASMPHADNFQLHIYAALAEQEREFISKRTKAALKVASDHGVKLGGLRDKTMQRNVAIQAKANREAKKLIKLIGPMRQGGKSLGAIAEALNGMSVPTSRGGSWTAMQVSRVLDRAAA